MHSVFERFNFLHLILLLTLFPFSIDRAQLHIYFPPKTCKDLQYFYVFIPIPGHIGQYTTYFMIQNTCLFLSLPKTWCFPISLPCYRVGPWPCQPYFPKTLPNLSLSMHSHANPTRPPFFSSHDVLPFLLSFLLSFLPFIFFHPWRPSIVQFLLPPLFLSFLHSPPNILILGFLNINISYSLRRKSTRTIISNSISPLENVFSHEFDVARLPAPLLKDTEHSWRIEIRGEKVSEWANERANERSGAPDR